MAEQWWVPQQKWSGQLVLCRLLGFPPWPGVALKPRSRSELQGPMNPLAPPTDAVFDREVKCVRRGAGFTVGNTASAHYAVNNPCSAFVEKYRLQMFNCSLDLTSRRKHQRLTCSALFAFIDCSSHKCETLLVNAAPTKLVRPASSFAIRPLAANFCDDLLTTKV